VTRANRTPGLLANVNPLGGLPGQLNQLHPEPEQRSLLRWHAEVSARPSAEA
jgi:hypothetical protein